MRKWSGVEADIRTLELAQQLVNILEMTGNTKDTIAINNGKSRTSWTIKITSERWKEEGR